MMLRRSGGLSGVEGDSAYRENEGALVNWKQSQRELDLIGMNIPTTEQEVAELSMREAVLPPRVQRLRQKLSRKAKEQKRFRFYSLYDKIIDKETLMAAYRQVRANDGAPGVDGVTLTRIDEVIGEERFVEELHNELKAGQYKASPVRREYIPKANGNLRPLGIPVIKDRVVQAAVVLIIEPIFEADFEDCSYGFRPGRSAHQALEQITAALKAGKTEVYDADLEGFFDSIPHDRLEVRKDESGRWRGIGTNQAVAGSAGSGRNQGGWESRKGTPLQGDQEYQRHSARGSSLTTIGQPLFALVRPSIPIRAGTGKVGKSCPGKICGRFCHTEPENHSEAGRFC